MAKKLVIVESPAKAKTIKKYLGSGYEVVASKGHVKDLPTKPSAVDVENDFTETYAVIEGKEKVLDELKAAAKNADAVLLATDPDREGEAIAFHIQQEIMRPKLKVERVEFHEITKKGVEHGVAHPRELDEDLYDAQRARRVLDRIVGYDVTALVWSKLAFGLAAGRVQSVALRLIVDREREIEAFVPDEYWNIGAGLTTPQNQAVPTRLLSVDGESRKVTDGVTAAAIRADLETATFRVAKVVRREQKRKPPAPFTTSKLQQDATSYLRFGAKRTMQIAQGLYEGVDLKQDGGPVGLITYMRTDSTRVSDDAVKEVRELIEKRFGAQYLPDAPNVYKSRKNAQDAHEAIRPTNVEMYPESVRKYLKEEQYKLYKLIWNRFIASQMTPAVYDRTSVDIDAKPTRAGKAHASYALRAAGQVEKFAGWLQAADGQREFAGEDEAEAPEGTAPVAKAPSVPPPAEDDAGGLLPELNEGVVLTLATPPGVNADQKFTQPPARFNEGSLVRELERRGIGRPSTYAETIGKVQQRAYAEKLSGGGLQPSQLGKMLVDGLVRSELEFMNPGFTAQMEEELDEVGAGKLKRLQFLKRFYKSFRQQLEKSKKLASWKPPAEKTEFTCDDCGSAMLKKWGKNGYFLSCEKYPKCKGTRDLGPNGDGTPAPVRMTDILCDKCGKPFLIKSGRFGEFLSCTGYPACKNTRPIPLGVPCPQCGGDIIEIRSKKKGGRSFYGCANYSAAQKCEFKLWARPVPEPCPQCGAKFLTKPGGKKPMLVCATKDCGYKAEIQEAEPGAVDEESTDEAGEVSRPSEPPASAPIPTKATKSAAKKAPPSKPAAAARRAR